MKVNVKGEEFLVDGYISTDNNEVTAAINIFGGFFVTQRMLEMFKTKKEKK